MIKLKFLKEISILNNKFVIVWDKTHNGGSFNFAESKINIGIKCYKIDPEYTFGILMHELSEAIHAACGYRYDDGRIDNDYLFCFRHKEFELHNAVLSSLIIKFIKQ